MLQAQIQELEYGVTLEIYKLEKRKIRLQKREIDMKLSVGIITPEAAEMLHAHLDDQKKNMKMSKDLIKGIYLPRITQTIESLEDSVAVAEGKMTEFQRLTNELGRGNNSATWNNYERVAEEERREEGRRHI